MSVDRSPLSMLPPGTDPAITSEFDAYGNGRRLIASKPTGLPTAEVVVTAWQLPDGRLIAHGPDAPHIQCGDAEFSPDEARTIGAALTDAADLADQWAARADCEAARLWHLDAALTHIDAAITATEGIAARLPVDHQQIGQLYADRAELRHTADQLRDLYDSTPETTP